MDYAVII